MSPLMMVSLRFRFRMVSVEVGFEDALFRRVGSRTGSISRTGKADQGYRSALKWLVYLERGGASRSVLGRLDRERPLESAALDMPRQVVGDGSQGSWTV